MKIKYTIFFLFISLFMNSQSFKNQHYQTIKKELINFLIKNGDILEDDIKDYNNDVRHLYIEGLYNKIKNQKFIDGIYCFGKTTTHSKGYFFIYQNEKCSILNLSIRKDLDESIKKILDFCELNKYCSEITNEYISRIITIYYNKNKPAGYDINCVNGISDTKKLP